MQVSNNVKGIIALIQSLMMVFGTSQYVGDPTHPYYALLVAIAGAIIGAVKHWADTQNGSTPTPQGPTS